MPDLTPVEVGCGKGFARGDRLEFAVSIPVNALHHRLIAISIRDVGSDRHVVQGAERGRCEQGIDHRCGVDDVHGARCQGAPCLPVAGLNVDGPRIASLRERRRKRVQAVRSRHMLAVQRPGQHRVDDVIAFGVGCRPRNGEVVSSVRVGWHDGQGGDFRSLVARAHNDVGGGDPLADVRCVCDSDLNNPGVARSRRNGREGARIVQGADVDVVQQPA